MTTLNASTIDKELNISPCTNCDLYIETDPLYIKNPRNCRLWLNQKNECPVDEAATNFAVNNRNDNSKPI